MSIKRPVLRPRIHAPAFLIGAALLLLTAACGGGGSTGSSGQAAGGKLNPCTLVSQKEASDALGASVGEPTGPVELNSTPRLAACGYKVEGGQTVTVTIRVGMGPSDAKSGFNVAQSENPSAQTLTDLGYDAFATSDRLFVLKGDIMLEIEGVPVDKAKALAKIALKRI